MHAYDLPATTKDEAEIQDKNNPNFVSPDESSPATTVVVQDLTDISLTSLSSSHYTQQPETQPIDDASQQIAETSDSTALHELFNLTKWVDLFRSSQETEKVSGIILRTQPSTIITYPLVGCRRFETF